MVDACVFGLDGPYDVKVQTMRCTAYACRTTFGPNFYTDNGSKINTASIADVKEVLFISTKRGFTVNYLRYHTQLEFRAFVSGRGIEDVYSEVFGASFETHTRFRRSHADALMYWSALNEFQVLGIHKDSFPAASLSRVLFL